MGRIDLLKFRVLYGRRPGGNENQGVLFLEEKNMPAEPKFADELKHAFDPEKIGRGLWFWVAQKRHRRRLAAKMVEMLQQHQFRTGVVNPVMTQVMVNRLRYHMGDHPSKDVIRHMLGQEITLAVHYNERERTLPLRLVCIGDSMTDRTEPEGRPLDRLQWKRADQNLGFYPKALADDMQARVWSFSTFQTGADDRPWYRIGAWAIELAEGIEPDVLIIQGGGDDLDGGVEVPEMVRDYGFVMGTLLAAGHKVLFLEMPYSHKPEGELRDKRIEFNTRLRQLFPIHTLAYHHIIHDLKMTIDGLHPNDEGCVKMAELIGSGIRRVMGDVG